MRLFPSKDGITERNLMIKPLCYMVELPAYTSLCRHNKDRHKPFAVPILDQSASTGTWHAVAAERLQ